MIQAFKKFNIEKQISLQNMFYSTFDAAKFILDSSASLNPQPSDSEYAYFPERAYKYSLRQNVQNEFKITDV